MSYALQRILTTASIARRMHQQCKSSSRALSLFLDRPSINEQPVIASSIILQSSSSIYASSHHRAISTTPIDYKSAMPLAMVDEDDTTAATSEQNNNSSSSSNTNTNSTPFLLADIGEGINEVELLQWFVSPGDTVVQFDRICEVQSDKAAVEITSRFDGVVESLCGNVGDMMFVGKPLLYIATAGGNARVGGGGDGGWAASSVEAEAQEVPMTTLNNVNDEENRLNIMGTDYANYYEGKDESIAAEQAKVLTSPAVRKLAKENNIDLGTIIGTGPKGRVLKSDVLKLIDTNSGGCDTTPSSSAMDSSNKKLLVSSPTIEKDTVIPIRGYSRLMVKSMTSSLQVPHMVYADEINVNALTAVRDALRPLAKDMGVPKLTYLPFFIKAASLAMSKHPVLNSTIDVEEMTLTYHKEHRIGVAVDTDRGLAVPVVSSCQERSVLEIAEELNRLYSLAMDGNLAEDDITNPTFTLSNIGAIGGTYMQPVVLPPQVAIGALGRIQRLPRFVSDDSDIVEVARIMPVSWGGDHRAVDGATMARFSNLWKSYCENPSSMMFAMR